MNIIMFTIFNSYLSDMFSIIYERLSIKVIAIVNAAIIVLALSSRRFCQYFL